MNMLLYQILANTIHGYYKKTHRKINVINKFRHGMKNLSYLMDLYSVSDIENYLEYIFRKHVQKTDNPAIRVYVNKKENRIEFKIKTAYF